ncbi:hypothetical protein evm_010613 [Chilo suppressalis]|nr:hypothetical protein evm_010613 [Chilo suppressalis]
MIKIPINPSIPVYSCRTRQYEAEICDCKCRILTVNTKFGGATHDAFVWENSRINSHMQSFHRNGEYVWLLGLYPQRSWLMTPYSDPAPGTAADSYNNAHRRARVTVENTFGRLKNRWRCTSKDRVLHYKPEKCAKIILACCVLHNLALKYGLLEPENFEPVDFLEFLHVEVPEEEKTVLLGSG